jgi:excisionase family DNA binding protein
VPDSRARSIQTIADQLDRCIQGADREGLYVLLALLSGRRAVVYARLKGLRFEEERDRGLTVAVAAEAVGCHEDTLREMCRQGRVRFFYAGHRMMIPRSAVTDLLRGRRGEGQ